MSAQQPEAATVTGETPFDPLHFDPVYLRHRTLLHGSMWVGGAIVGGAAVLYAKLIGTAQAAFGQYFSAHPWIASAFVPLAFVAATGLVRRLAPDAKGSGIPQVLHATDLARDTSAGETVWTTELVSPKTTLVKVVSSLVGSLGGASIGREGPTVQIAASGFAFIARQLRRFVPRVDMQSFLIAGGAAGVAAAFNTPLAGITFALEELSEMAFGPFRQMIMLAVIVAGITAQAFAGNYLYFRHPELLASTVIVIPQALALGLVAGGLGGAFARLLAFTRLTRLPKQWWPRALVCGVLCAAICLVTGGTTAGSGYEVTLAALNAPDPETAGYAFPLLKAACTVFSYLSGMAGGIFAPCLSIGAGMGLAFAKLAHFANFRACALMGMVAFFSGTIQAPLTAVVIVAEMSDENALILPFMIAAFVAHGVGKWFMPQPLYRYLADHYEDR